MRSGVLYALWFLAGRSRAKMARAVATLAAPTGARQRTGIFWRAISEMQMQNDRDQRSGRFLSGCKPGPGRSRGSRNRLADAFIADLREVWEAHGIQALEKCALEEPSQFLRVIASLMPRDINLNVAIDAASFADRFAQAAALLGQDIEPPRRPRKLLPGQRVIEHDDVG
jgi:hypothetical protein